MSEATDIAPTMLLTAENHCFKVMTGLHSLRKSSVLCDYSLVAEGEVINVHKAVLAACSDYFHVMLTGSMRESREGLVELKGVSCTGLQVVVDFAYSGVLELDSDNVEEVLAAATHLQVTDAVDLCSRYLEAAITIENCVDILNLTELYSLEHTREETRKFILERFEVFAESEHYYKLTSTQMASLLSENCLRVMSEYRLFELVLKWIAFDKANRESSVADLMRNVRLPLLSGEELVDKVSRVPIMKQNPDCVDLLTDAKDYHIVVSKQALLQTWRTQVRSDRTSLVMCNADNLESYTLETKRYAFLKDCTIPLYNPCVVVVDNFMYACGGKYDSNDNNEIATARCFRYDPRFDSWFELPSMNEARKDFVVVVHNRKLYAIAGQDENMVMCTMECFSITENEWEKKASQPQAVFSHAGALCNGRIYISGGQKFTGCCSQLSCYDPESDLWEDKEPMLNARCNHSMAEVANKLYITGGNIEDGYGFAVPVISIETYCPVSNQWTLCKRTLNIREAGSCVVGSKIYIVGGINGEHYYSDLVQSYNPLDDTICVIEKFPTRIYCKACCILTLPQYV